MATNCGPKPDINDFLKPNGRVRWGSYNKANTRWLRCIKTTERQDPANVAARQETAQQLGSQAISVGGNLAQGVLASQGFYTAAGSSGPVDMRQPSAKPPAPQADELPPWALPAAGAALVLFLLNR